MSTQYTEGPWETFKSTHADGSPATVIRSARTGACVGWPAGPNDSEIEANAALQALAPRMLEACEYMLAHAFERKWDGDERAYSMLSSILRSAPRGRSKTKQEPSHDR